MDDSIQKFNSRATTEPSVLTLAGTGLNGAAQVAILCQIGIEKLSSLEAINIVSGSSFSYFIVQAYVSGGLRQDKFTEFDTLNRHVHRAHTLRALGKLGAVVLSQASFFQNALLGETGRNLFSEEFCTRPLSSFPLNLRFWAYCRSAGQLVEISVANGFGAMTVTELIRATASAYFLHGPFHYGEHQFLDPNFSPKAAALIKQFFSLRGNHLFVNFKRSGTRGTTLLLKQDDSARPLVALIRDLAYFTLGIPNRHIRRTHIYALQELSRFSQGAG